MVWRSFGVRAAGAAALLIVVAGVSPGCAGKSSGSSGGTPIPLESLPQAYAEKVCRGLQACCASSGLAWTFATCEATLRGLADLPSSTANFTYDAAAAGACLDAVEAAMRSCAGFAEEPEACRRTFTGRVAAGGACEHDLECAVPAGADDAECIEGTCVVEVRGTQGTPCSTTCRRVQSETTCESGMSGGSGTATCWIDDGLHCATEGTCQPVGTLGEACNGFMSCASDAFCDGSRCAAPRQVGERCTWRDQCASGHCDTDASEPTCVVGAANGAACDRDSQCASDQCVNGRCTPDLFGQYTCSGPPPGSGGAALEGRSGRGAHATTAGWPSLARILRVAPRR